MSSLSQRRPSLSSKQGAEALEARRNCGPASSTRKDLHALGIDLDSDVIERLQALGLHKAWAVASKAALCLKDRSTSAKPKLEESCAISPIKLQHSMRKREEKEVEATILEVPLEKEWMAIDNSRVSTIYRDLNNRESPLPANVRVQVLRLLKLFKTSYGKSPDRFIQQMMGRKTSKEPLEARQLVMKTRFVTLTAFTDIIKRLSSQANEDQITCMFEVIGERKMFGEQEVFILDLWMFLALLQHAEEENRRSYDFKTSRIAQDVEFWNSQNKSDNVNRNTDNRRRRSPQKGRPSSASVADKDQKRRSVKQTHTSVAEAFGSAVRPNTAYLNQGKYIHGSFSRERDAVGTSVSEALNTPRRPEKVNRVSLANDSIVFGEKVVPLGRHKLSDKFEPTSMTSLMTEGVGTSKAIYGRSLSPPGRRAGSSRSTSLGCLQRDGQSRSTTVAEALGTREDFRGRPGSPGGPVDARKRVSTLGKPPYVL